MKFLPVPKINGYVMPIHTNNGATVCTPEKFALTARVNRLKRELRNNTKKGN